MKENVNAFKGPGIQAASMASDKCEEVLLTGFCEPKAFKVLNAEKINVANEVEGTARDAAKSFNK